ncbi:MAG: response regulator [Polyangiaceae bacterium]|jgi:CheY-like chemotaxis protein|nr:response regulator [Polyangiaceae bacterium]
MVQVVYIDDEPVLCRVFARLLTRSGLTVVTFSDPVEAMAYLRTHEVPVVVCDYRMPELSGLQVIDGLERAGAFFIVSGDLDAEALVSGHPRVTGLLTKPFRPEVLVGAIRAVLAEGPVS